MYTTKKIRKLEEEFLRLGHMRYVVMRWPVIWPLAVAVYDYRMNKVANKIERLEVLEGLKASMEK
jgi:hypothetical protein